MMFYQPCDIAAMDASSGEAQVIAPAPGNAKQLKLTRVRLCVSVRFSGCMSQSDISFDAITKHTRRSFQLFTRTAKCAVRQLAHGMKRGEQASLGFVDLLFMETCGNLSRVCWR